MISQTLFAFSSYTKGLYHITSLAKKSNHYLIEIKLPPSFQAKLSKKQKQFGEDLFLSVDGIPALVLNQTVDQNFLSVEVKITTSVFENSTLKSLKAGDKVSIGNQSRNKEKYLIESNPVDFAKLKDHRIAKGHQYTQALTFETSSQFPQVFNHQWLGLNGSGFFIQHARSLRDKTLFSIHIGQQTKELTILGSSDMKVGQGFNLSMAKK